MDESKQDVRFPLQKGDSKQLSKEHIDYLKHYREHLFYSRSKPMLLEIINAILEQQFNDE